MISIKNTQTHTIFEEIYFNLYVFVALFTPLIYVSNMGELFELPKTLFIYLAAILVFSIFLIQQIIIPTKIKKPPLSVIIFLFSFTISTVFSSHLYTSIWGYYSRFSDALASTLSLFILYFVAYNRLHPDDLHRLITISVLPILPISLFGISQHYGVLGGILFFGEKDPRVFSTLGQPNWLAQYLVMLLPFVLFKFMANTKSLFWLFLYLIGYICLIFTYSLSGFAGMFFGYSASVYFIVKHYGLSKTRLKLFLLSLFMLITPFSFPGLLTARLHDLKKDIFSYVSLPVYAQDKINPADYKLSDAGYIRKKAWMGTWNLIKSSPKIFIIGTGPETFPYAFQPFRPLALNYSSEWSYIFNKPHNYYLETMSELGLLGLLSYVILFVYLYRRTTVDKKAGLIGFAITNVFGWPILATMLIYWIWLMEVTTKDA